MDFHASKQRPNSPSLLFCTSRSILIPPVSKKEPVKESQEDVDDDEPSKQQTEKKEKLASMPTSSGMEKNDSMAETTGQVIVIKPMETNEVSTKETPKKSTITPVMSLEELKEISRKRSLKTLEMVDTTNAKKRRIQQPPVQHDPNNLPNQKTPMNDDDSLRCHATSMIHCYHPPRMGIATTNMPVLTVAPPAIHQGKKGPNMIPQAALQPRFFPVPKNGVIQKQAPAFWPPSMTATRIPPGTKKAPQIVASSSTTAAKRKTTKKPTGIKKTANKNIPADVTSNSLESDDDDDKNAVPLLSMETLKDMSRERALRSQEIAHRIIAQDESSKKVVPWNHQFPCPAKKMGPAHNKNTAYFVISPNSPHGMPLTCSHALCRKGRVKFNYCRYCNQPVSRMKFDERHAHPEQLLLELADSKR